MGVAIHPELYFEILRPMVKKVAQSDLPFLSYGQKTAIFVLMKKAIFGYFFKIVSLIELNLSSELCIEILRGGWSAITNPEPQICQKP